MDSSDGSINKLLTKPHIKIKIRVRNSSSQLSHPDLQETPSTVGHCQQALLASPPDGKEALLGLPSCQDRLMRLAEAAERILGNVYPPTQNENPIPLTATRTVASTPQEDHHRITSSALVAHEGLDTRNRNWQENEALIHHPRKKAKSNMLYRCTDCYKKFPSPQALGGHRTGCHLRPQNPNIKASCSSKKRADCEGGEHPCPRCHKSFRSFRALNGHTRVHSTKGNKDMSSAYALPLPPNLSPPSGGCVSSVSASLSRSPAAHNEPSTLPTSSASQSSETYEQCQFSGILQPGSRDESEEHKYQCCDLNMSPPSEEEVE